MDYKGKEVRKLIVNGRVVKDRSCFSDHKIHLPRELLKLGENDVKVRFVSAYVRDCQGLHYFMDTEDNEEYIYSQCEAADGHVIFPCFD